MRPLQIRRWRNPNIDPKQALRMHVDRLAIDQQRLFVEMALQLISSRNELCESEKWFIVRQPQRERKQ